MCPGEPHFVKQGEYSTHTALPRYPKRVSSPLDYKSAGVDIEAGNEAVRRIKAHAARTHSPAVLTGLGAFGSLFSLRDALDGLADPVMVQSTDGCGTKTKVTVMAGREADYANLGRDLVAAVAGDIAVMGARPLTFLDYLGVHRVEPTIIEALVRGMSDACEEADIALVGGETAEMPAVYAQGELDVVGMVTGVCDRDKLITGAAIQANDVVYGVSSSGLHTNGYSLARKLLFEIGNFAIHDAPPELLGATLAEVLLAPHSNYVASIRRMLEAGLPVHGMAHITGGGLVENVPRIVPEGLGPVIDRASWTPQPIFSLMQKLGQLSNAEMLRTFNMGVGLVIIAPAGLRDDLSSAFSAGIPMQVWELGRVEAGVSGVRFTQGDEAR